MTSAQPQPAAPVVDPTADSQGLPVEVGSRVAYNGHTGTVRDVRPGAGVLIFADDVDGKQRSAIIANVIHVPADEPAPSAGDLHRPDPPSANRVEDQLAEIQDTLNHLQLSTDPACGEFVKAPGPCSLDRSAKHNWVEDVGGLPNYICQIARAVARGGKTLDSAIPIAVATVKRWAAGGVLASGKKISPAVQARAAAAVAEWEKKKAAAHAKSAGKAVAGCEVLEFLAEPLDGLLEIADGLEFEADLVELADGESGEFLVKPGTDLPPQAPSAKRKARHYKQHPAGSPGGVGGQFAPGKGGSSKGTDPKKAKTVRKHVRRPQATQDRQTATPAAKDTSVTGKPTPEKAPHTPKPADTPNAKKPAEGTPGKPGSQEIVHPAPSSHNGSPRTAGPFEDGSARYADGSVWDPIAGQFRRSAADKTKKSPNFETTEDDPLMTVTASAEFAPEEYQYFYNPDTNETFRVATSGESIDVFAPLVDEQAEPVWQTVDPKPETVTELRTLPEVDDADTLESLVGAALANQSPEVEIVETAEEPTAPVNAIVAAAVEADPEVEAPEGAGEGEGPRFRIPIVIPEGVWSGDRRRFSVGALQAKEPPMPLLWQRETDEGHKRSVIVGRIDSLQNLETGGLGNAEGVFDTHPDAVEAARQVRGRFLTGVSGDVDMFDHELSEDEEGREAMDITSGRLVAATLVAKPAFQEATIELLSDEGEEMPPVITAAGGPLNPPAGWFANPGLSEPTRLTMTPDGRVFGHIAEWGTPHLGNPRLKPPRSRQAYRYFNRKPVATAEGADVFTGQLTLMGGHAAIDMDPDRAAKHYDDTRSAVADVVAGEDEFGIWVAGAMRPGLSDQQIRAFRASEPSGDWRERDGNLELCAVCQVNVAGFPVNARPRAMVASSGEVTALVAAGMVGYTEVRQGLADQVAALQQQLTALVTEWENQKKEGLARIIYDAIGQI